jgi:hypothetical protein
MLELAVRKDDMDVVPSEKKSQAYELSALLGVSFTPTG